MTKTQPPPALDPRRPVPADEVSQTYARDAARRLTVPAPPRDLVELEVDALFTAEAIVAESRGTVLSRAVERANARRIH